MEAQKGLTKSAKIMALHARGLSTRAIALEVYGTDCNVPTKMAYVRIVTRQRKGGGLSSADIRYIETKFGTLKNRNDASRLGRQAYYRKRWREDPDYRKRKTASVAAWVKANPERRRAIKAASRARIKLRTCAELTNQ